MEKFMIKDLPQALIDTATKLLMETRLFELAYARKDALNEVRSHAKNLAEKMVMVHHAVDSRDLSHWKTTTNEHISSLFDGTFLTKNKRLDKNDFTKIVFDQQLGEYDDYLRKHSRVKNLKKDTHFSDPSENDYIQITSKYKQLIDNIYKNKVDTPVYEELK
jgi:hypothetical protein